MKAVFLDYATIGARELDSAPLFAVMPELEIYDDTSNEQRAARVHDAAIVLTNKVHIRRDLFEQAGSLRFIGVTATGTDNIDLAAAEENGVAVANIRAYCTQSVVEHVFAVMLNLTHNIARYHRSVREGNWQRSDNFCMLDYPIRELSAMTLGLVGRGELGRGVERIAKQFGTNVMIARRAGTEAQAGDGRHDLREVLQAADVVSLHCPLTDATRGLIGADELALMKPTAILINTARGGLVDSAALAAALAEGQIGAAAIDVLAQEPPFDGDPLLDYEGDNLIVTPHIAWGTREARQNAVNELAANVKAFLNGQERNRVV